MGTFDDFEQLFRTIGLSEEASRRAAQGRYRSENEAREAYLEDEAGDLADRLVVEAQARPSATQQELRQVSAQLTSPAMVSTIAENVRRGLSGLPMVAAPAAERVPLPAAAEAIVPTVREALRMTEADARSFSSRLHEREARRGGPAHAARFLESFADGLRGSSRFVREVAV